MDGRYFFDQRKKNFYILRFVELYIVYIRNLFVSSKYIVKSLINSIDAKIGPLHNIEIWQMRLSATCGIKQT